MKIQNVKGCYDFGPKEQKVKNDIKRILEETFESFGYLPLETPILCYYDMLSDKYDEENDILKEIYRLKDQGDRDLGLRYDLTVPFAKYIALNKNEIRFPFKRYEMSKVFRDGPVKLGRDREFTQCDIDVVGLSGQEIEVELINLYVTAFNKMKIDIEIEYNSRNLMRGLVEEFVSDKDLILNVITIIDKVKKITKEEFISSLKEYGITEENSMKLLEYFKGDFKTIKEACKDSKNELIRKGIEELDNLNRLLKSCKLTKYCKFTPSLARGQEYYTGNVFEVYDKSGTLTSSIGGGGRYDKMITDFIDDGNTYPAVGVSFGLSSLYELLRTREEYQESSNVDIYIIPMNTFEESFDLASRIRELGYNVLLEMENKKLKKCLDYANKEQIPYTIVLGSDEVEKKEFNLKDMKTGESVKIVLSHLKQIQKIIKKS
ncbi:MAG: histidine--tRNA ligase [Bacilli bacterium]|nr:histidine--tRNA ligase [Bacilli bacterium]